MALGCEYDMVLSHPEPHRPATTSRISRLGAGGARAAALVTLARHDVSGTTLTPRELRAMRRTPPTSHARLLVQSPWLGTYLA